MKFKKIIYVLFMVFLFNIFNNEVNAVSVTDCEIKYNFALADVKKTIVAKYEISDNGNVRINGVSEDGVMSLQSVFEENTNASSSAAGGGGYTTTSKLYFYSKSNDFKTFYNEYKKNVDENGKCPAVVWCQDHTKATYNAYYLELGDSSKICQEKIYVGDNYQVNDEEGNVSGGTISVEEREEFYKDKFPTLIYGGNLKKFANCEELLKGEDGSDDALELLRFLVWLIRISVPLLLIVLGSLDFAKAVFSSEDEMKKAQGKFVKRIVISIVIFLIPSLLEFLLTIAHGIWPDYISADFCGIL